jgi:uncharacterized protein (TIGR02996 family)
MLRTAPGGVPPLRGPAADRIPPYAVAMGAARVEELLEAALATWRRTGAAGDAAAFEARAHAALVLWSPPTAGSERAFHRAWLRAADDAVGRGWALTTLLEQLPGADAIQRAVALAKRVDVLARHAPDPRFPRAAAMVRGSDSALAVPRLRAALARLEAAAPVHTPGALPRVTEFPPQMPEIAALWQAVQASPDDDGPLAVLADALQLAGDPRGEVIALQLLTGTDDLAQIARRQALMASCGDAWLGRLAPFTASASFERGVLRRLQLARDPPAHDRRWDTVIDDPALATVTDLIGSDANSEVYARLVASPVMRSLARVDVLDRRTARALVDAAPSLVHVTCSFADPSETFDVADALQRRPCITSIAIAESELDRIAGAPWFVRLSAVTLGVGTHIRRGLARWGSLPRSMAFTLVPDVRLPACTTSYPWDFGITLRRDGAATIARISGEWLLLPLDILTALPPDVTRVEVDHPNDAMIDRVRSAIARPGLEVVQRHMPCRAAVFVPIQRGF